jgi:hypothetical protein
MTQCSDSTPAETRRDAPSIVWMRFWREAGSGKRRPGGGDHRNFLKTAPTERVTLQRLGRLARMSADHNRFAVGCEPEAAPNLVWRRVARRRRPGPAGGSRDRLRFERRSGSCPRKAVSAAGPSVLPAGQPTSLLRPSPGTRAPADHPRCHRPGGRKCGSHRRRS